MDKHKTGAAIHEILITERINADPDRHTITDRNIIYKDILSKIGRIARALYRDATEYVHTYNIRYQDTPTPDKCPIQQWEKEWLHTGIVQKQGNIISCSFPQNIEDTPYLSALPPIQETHTFQTGITARKNSNNSNRRNESSSL